MFADTACAVTGMPQWPATGKTRGVSATSAGGPKSPAKPDPTLVSASRQGTIPTNAIGGVGTAASTSATGSWGTGSCARAAGATRHKTSRPPNTCRVHRMDSSLGERDNAEGYADSSLAPIPRPARPARAGRRGRLSTAGRPPGAGPGGKGEGRAPCEDVPIGLEPTPPASLCASTGGRGRRAARGGTQAAPEHRARPALPRGRARHVPHGPSRHDGRDPPRWSMDWPLKLNDD